MLRVDLKDWENSTRYAVYQNFSVGDEASNFRLTVGGYSGNAGCCKHLRFWHFLNLQLNHIVSAYSFMLDEVIIHRISVHFISLEYFE